MGSFESSSEGSAFEDVDKYDLINETQHPLQASTVIITPEAAKDEVAYRDTTISAVCLIYGLVCE